MSEKDQLRNRVELIVRRELAQMNKDKAKSILVVLDGGMAPIDGFLNQLASCQQEGCDHRLLHPTNCTSMPILPQILLIFSTIEGAMGLLSEPEVS